MVEAAPVIRLAPVQFSLQERDRRYAAVRARMTARGLDYLLVPHNTGDWDNYQPDLRYLSCIGGGGMAAAFVLPAKGEPVAAVRENRRIAWWLASQNWVSDVRSPPQFMWSRFFIQVLQESGVSRNARIGVVGLSTALRDPEGTISFGEFTALQKAFPEASFECATDIMYEVRKRKSAEEIGFVERAQICADAINDAFRATVRPGVPEHEVYANMFSAHIKAGGEVPCMILFNAEKKFTQTHLLPTFRSLEKDDVLMVEAEPKYYGYMAQAVISASLRPLSDQERLLFNASQECFDDLLSELRPGRSYKSLVEKWKAVASRKGVSAGRTMGHGLGLGQDGPLTTPSGDAGGLQVEEGDVLVLKPWVSDDDDAISVRVGDTVVVGHSSARRLGHRSLMPLVVT
jgi:Xaa-Pro dipeptidase